MWFLCALAKIHQSLANNFPKFIPILSAINKATYGWAKFFVPLLLRRFILNDHTIKDFLEYVDDIIQQNSSWFMVSLDIDSIFTNISVDETISICIGLQFKEHNVVSASNKKQMFVMPLIALKKSIILNFTINTIVKLMWWLKVSPSDQPSQIFFCVTTKLLGLKDAQENSDWNNTKDLWIIIFTSWKTWVFTTICWIYEQTASQNQIFSRSWKE